MKTLPLLFLICGALLYGETKAETDLKKQLEAAQSALSAERQRAAALSAGTQKLTEVVAETNKEAGKKIEQVAIKSEADKVAIVETVKSAAAANQVATKRLADVMENQVSAVSAAVSVQGQRQQAALIAAREVAQQLQQSNRELAERNRENERAKIETAAKLEAMTKTLQDIKYKADIAAAKDEAGARHERYKLISDIGMGLIPVLLALVVWMQMKANGQAKATHTMVNGERTQREAYIKEMEGKLVKEGQPNGEN